jgi:hypothetical protein
MMTYFVNLIYRSTVFLLLQIRNRVLLTILRCILLTRETELSAHFLRALLVFSSFILFMMNSTTFSDFIHHDIFFHFEASPFQVSDFFRSKSHRKKSCIFYVEVSRLSYLLGVGRFLHLPDISKHSPLLIFI